MKNIRVLIKVYVKYGHFEAAIDDEILRKQNNNKAITKWIMLTSIQYNERNKRCVCLHKLFVKQ